MATINTTATQLSGRIFLTLKLPPVLQFAFIMAALIESFKSSVHQILYDEKSVLAPYIKLVEAKTGLDRTKLAYGFAAFLAVYLIFGYGAQLITNLIGFSYPAYASIKAVESSTKEDDTKWLTYWIVFAFFSLIEYFADIIVSWVPFYWLAKCVFLVWCFLPFAGNGSSIIYNRYIRPQFLKNQDTLDNFVNSAVKTGKKVADYAKSD